MAALDEIIATLPAEHRGAFARMDRLRTLERELAHKQLDYVRMSAQKKVLRARLGCLEGDEFRNWRARCARAAQIIPGENTEQLRARHTVEAHQLRYDEWAAHQRWVWHQERVRFHGLSTDPSLEQAKAERDFAASRRERHEEEFEGTLHAREAVEHDLGASENPDPELTRLRAERDAIDVAQKPIIQELRDIDRAEWDNAHAQDRITEEIKQIKQELAGRSPHDPGQLVLSLGKHWEREDIAFSLNLHEAIQCAREQRRDHERAEPDARRQKADMLAQRRREHSEARQRDSRAMERG